VNLVCDQGACVPSSDAAATTCIASHCPNSCIPVYQVVCCKADNTCGCELLGTPAACE
jgi:hypothetical protein